MQVGFRTKKCKKFRRVLYSTNPTSIDIIYYTHCRAICQDVVLFDFVNFFTCSLYNRVKTAFEKENINTLTMTSEFMISLYGSFAQAESESISKNVSWGKEKAYREGKVQFQYKHLLGYKKGADGKPEIIPEEAETVKLRV